MPPKQAISRAALRRLASPPQFLPLEFGLDKSPGFLP